MSLKVMRILRIYKLVRHFAGLQSLFYTLQQARAIAQLSKIHRSDLSSLKSSCCESCDFATSPDPNEETVPVPTFLVSPFLIQTLCREKLSQEQALAGSRESRDPGILNPGIFETEIPGFFGIFCHYVLDPLERS